MQCLATVIALDDRNIFWRAIALIKQASNPQRSLQTKCDFSLHIGKLELDQLIGRQRTVELLAVEGMQVE